ncbi:hypothetical protein RE9431_15340 [Prescottella equi]|nr:hypothetical protein RE9431_15340 [Prescottella equi]BCN72932.1 hypothetical protein RE0327_15310 [Prescottella equi]BCN77930.1 hypothetical protein RE0346_15900 [Prescottella equi]
MEVVLGREVMEQQTPGHAGLVGDVLDGDLFERPVGQHPDTEVDELGTPFLRAQAYSFDGIHGPHLTELQSVSY